MKAIVFDLDNTLIDWKPEFIFALVTVLKDMKYNFSEDIIHKIDNCIDENEKHHQKLSKEELLIFINNNCNLNLPLEFIDKLIEKQKECIYSDRMLVKVIKYLSKKYDLYVVTNWFTETQKGRLDNMGILKYFKEVIGADINYFKPDKKAFDKILEKYKPEECISIGDTLENDVKTPLSLGMKALWKTNEKSTEYTTFSNLEELMALL